MFRVLSIIVFVSLIYWVIRYLRKNDLKIINIYKQFIDLLQDSWQNLKQFRTKNISENIISLRNLLFLVTLIEFDIMVITGFAPLILTGGNLTGILLLIHVAFAPLIALSFAVLVVLFAHSNRFESSDIKISEDNEGKKRIHFKNDAFLKISFWLIALFSLPAMISIILGMFPIYGTEGQVVLLEIHKYSVLIISILVILQIGILSVKLKVKDE